jgi:NAD+-dependent secondary alcohol dehydrogenase Adh1
MKAARLHSYDEDHLHIDDVPEPEIAGPHEVIVGGVEAVIDFVGEHGTTQQGPAMLAQGGTYLVVGDGGRVDLPAIDIIFSEINVVGNLVGNYTELSELMKLAAEGKVELTTHAYELDQINDAIDDLNAGRIQGRGVLIPS